MATEELVSSMTTFAIVVIGLLVLMYILYNLANYFSKKKNQITKITSETFKKNKFDNFIGIEIECLKKKGVLPISVSKLSECNFKKGSDHSIKAEKGYSGGYEYRCSPANGDELYKMVDGLSEELNKKGYKVNKSCGLHVHIETEPEVELLKKLYCFYSKFEGLFFAMLPKSRQDNDYCQKFKELDKYSYKDVLGVKDLRGFKSLFYETKSFYPTKTHGNKKRYSWVNFHSVFFRGTLEIRAHSGTINAEKIKNWIRMHLIIKKYLKGKSVEQIAKMKTSKERFLKLFPEDLQEYIKSRWEVFPTVAEENFREYSK